MIFRFDDISINTDMAHAQELLMRIWERFPQAEIIYCISPMVFDLSAHSDSKTRQRVFPKILNAYSDFRRYYEVSHVGIPHIPDTITKASHGLIHVDHRLLSKEAQELSILSSCSLARANIFCPPFNKWNTFTEHICIEHGIDLIKFEDGWRCVEYEPYDPDVSRWYLHSREVTVEAMEYWLESRKGK